jgi:hypothetical protein
MRRIVTLVVLGLCAAACGDSGGDELSAEDYRSEANAICTEGQQRAEELGEDLEAELGGSEEMPSADQLRDFMNPLLDDVEAQIDDIRALDGPEDLEGDVHAALDDAEDVLTEVRDDVEDDPIALLQSDRDPFEELNQRLDGLGLGECAE